jgi:hypothetical protein
MLAAGRMNTPAVANRPNAIASTRATMMACGASGDDSSRSMSPRE